MTFTVYASDAKAVKKRLDRIAAKAASYSVPFTYTVSDEHPQTVRVYDIDPVTLKQREVEQHMVSAVDFDIACESLIQADGWTIRAKVEHEPKGNIVTAFGNKPTDPAWFSVPAHCDHCKTSRVRKVTYFVEHESGKIQQVGKACLQDYTGIDPATVVLWAKVQDIFCDGMDCSVSSWRKRFFQEKMYSVPAVLAYAYDAIQEDGYQKSHQKNSTRDEVIKRVLAGREPSAAALEHAAKINAWLVNLDEKDPLIGDLERNCRTLAQSGWAATKHFGRLAYMPLAYERYLEQVATGQISDYVGQIGQPITIQVASVEFLADWWKYNRTNYLYQLTDTRGNVLIWYAPFKIEIPDPIDHLTIEATVKAHNIRKGIKQTVLVRCKGFQEIQEEDDGPTAGPWMHKPE